MLSPAVSPAPPPHAAPRATPDPSSDARLSGLLNWALGTADRAAGALRTDTLRWASSDASSRRYLRLDTTGSPATLILVDAPPATEDTPRFVAMAAHLRACGLTVPQIHAADPEQGYLLLEDLGETTFADALRAGTPDAELLRSATQALLRLQTGDPGAHRVELPEHDEAFLRRELDIWLEWYVARHHGHILSDAERTVVERTFTVLITRIRAQPRLIIHRDFHCRNLMWLAPARTPGILDFQGALIGPISYDLVSLLRDAYITRTEAEQLDVAIRWWEQARRAGLAVHPDFADFYRDFEWTGLQRHLKVLGQFVRLLHRDGKPGYMNDLPRVRDYVMQVTRRYVDLGPFNALLERLEKQTPVHGYTF